MKNPPLIKYGLFGFSLKDKTLLFLVSTTPYWFLIFTIDTVD